MTGVENSQAWRCSECDAPLMPVSSGSVCSRGCGKLHPPLPKKAERRNLALLAGLEDAIQKGDHWEIGGVPYERVKAWSKRVVGTAPKLEDGQVLALDGSRVVIFTPLGR